MDMTSEPRDVRDHYASMHKEYIEEYDPEQLLSRDEYPANYFRLELLKKRFADLNPHRILDAGAGSGIPALRLCEHIAARNVVAFDITPDMVTCLKELFQANGLSESEVFEGSIEDAGSFDRALQGGAFDAVLMLGVIPHVDDDLAVLRQARRCLNPGGRAFISFRNDLFNLFTMNRFTHDFIASELLSGVDEQVRQPVCDALGARLAMDKPPLRTTNVVGGAGYDTILAKSHNPLEAASLFSEAGFASTRLHWYHYHAALPMLDGGAIDRKAFRAASMKLEGSGDWRGHFLCSAYVVEAIA